MYQKTLNANTLYPKMPEIEIDLNGVLKLLANLKPGKAAGPDDIKPVLLKELRSKIAPTCSQNNI